MRVRKLDAAGDMQFGHNQFDFWRDVPDGPAQCVMTRLRLNYGEWWLDTLDGTPWDVEVLGFYTDSTRDPVVRARTSGTPGVNSIISYSSQLDRTSRKYSVQMTLDTIYGKTTISGPL